MVQDDDYGLWGKNKWVDVFEFIPYITIIILYAIKERYGNDGQETL
jgi:hypothetical protein